MNSVGPRSPLRVICVSTNMYADLPVNPHDRKRRRSSRSRHVCRHRRLLERGPSFGLRLATRFPSTSGTAKHLAAGAGGQKRDGANSP